MRLKSWTGFALAAIYFAAFASAYYAYWQRSDQFLADLPVVGVAMPYLFVARAVTAGEYSFSADMTGHVLSALAFCCLLAYAAGWIVETVLRGLIGLARRRP
jgi:hypothetical protein